MKTIMKYSFICVFLFITMISAHAVTLKRSSIVDTDTITVADVFDGAGDKSTRVLGIAPQPGTNMTLNARTLMRIAYALDLNWRPNHTGDQVILKRAATIIEENDIISAAKKALENKGIDGHFNIIFKEPLNTIVLPDNTQKTIEYHNVIADSLSDTFTADIYAPSKDNPIYSKTISGSIERLTEIPVLVNTIRHGSMISVRDITYMPIKNRDMKPNMVIDAGELIGMTPRRTIEQGKAITILDIIKPEAIARGNLVTVIFESGSLRLTAEGKALQNGAEGDSIRVLNTASNKTLQAMITNINEVTVRAF